MKSSMAVGHFSGTYEDLSEIRDQSKYSSSSSSKFSSSSSGYQQGVEPVKQTKDYLNDIIEKYDEESQSQLAQHHRYHREKVKSGVVSHNNNYQNIQTITGSEDKVPQVFQKFSQTKKSSGSGKQNSDQLEFSSQSDSYRSEQKPQIVYNGSQKYMENVLDFDQFKMEKLSSNGMNDQIDRVNSEISVLLRKLKNELEQTKSSEGNVMGAVCKDYMTKLSWVIEEVEETAISHILLKCIQELEILAIESIDNISGSDSKYFNSYLREIKVLVNQKLSLLDKGTNDQLYNPDKYQQDFLKNSSEILAQLTENDPLYATVVQAMYQEAIQLNLSPDQWAYFVNNCKA